MLDSERRRLSSSERLLRLFREGFSVMDLAEPLLSLDETASRAQARELMRREAVCHLGVRRDGRVVGHVRVEARPSRGRRLPGLRRDRISRKGDNACNRRCSGYAPCSPCSPRSG